MIIQYNGKQAEVEFDSNRDGSLFASSGTYVVSGVPLNDVELDDITDNYEDVMWQAALDRIISAADCMGDD